MKKVRSTGCFYIVLAIALFIISPVQANEGNYPNAPITIIVPYGAGGNGDLAARALSSMTPKLKALKGASVVVVNRAGAGGLSGSDSVIHAKNDGYTLLLARVGSQAVGPALDPSTPYKWDSFTFLGLLQEDPYVCVVKKDSPYKSFKDLLQAAKAHPQKLSYGTSGNMDASVAFPVSAFVDFGLKADAAIKIPYKSGLETVAALLGGYVDFSCNALAPYLGGIQSGDLRALVVSTKERVKDLPGVPTVGELGMENLEAVSGWSALYGPPSLPDAIVKTWSAALAELSGDKEWSAKVQSLGSVPSIMSPEKTKEFAKSQYEFYRSLSPYMGIGK